MDFLRGGGRQATVIVLDDGLVIALGAKASGGGFGLLGAAKTVAGDVRTSQARRAAEEHHAQGLQAVAAAIRGSGAYPAASVSQVRLARKDKRRRSIVISQPGMPDNFLYYDDPKDERLELVASLLSGAFGGKFVLER